MNMFSSSQQQEGDVGLLSGNCLGYHCLLHLITMPEQNRKCGLLDLDNLKINNGEFVISNGKYKSSLNYTLGPKRYWNIFCVLHSGSQSLLKNKEETKFGRNLLPKYQPYLVRQFSQVLGLLYMKSGTA